MSGGSYDYAYHCVDDFADSLRVASTTCGYESLELRKAFREHLRKVAAAMHAIEWNDSGDGDPNEQELIRRCLGERRGPKPCRPPAKPARP